jgi:DNA polymerase III alpha subunit
MNAKLSTNLVIMICAIISINTNIGSKENIDTNMAKRKNQNKLFLLSWDMHGLESLLDLTSLEKLREDEEKIRMWTVLSDPEAKDPGDQTGAALNRTVQSILMRARVNSQRRYEVYTIQTDANVSERDMWELFNNSPQQAADLIRERGNRLYSDRITPGTTVIT